MSTAPDATDDPRCSACDAPLIWAATANGKRVPIDRQPVPGGNIMLVPRIEDFPPLAHYVGKDHERAAGVEYHVSHFATCPSADRFRKRS